VNNAMNTPGTVPEDWPRFYRHQAQQVEESCLQAFYREGVLDPNTVIGKAPMVAMDFETTGLDAEQAEIVSIGIVPFDMRRIYCRQSCHWVVKPENELHEASIVIHGITHSDIEEAPRLHTILDQLLPLIAGKLVVVHYRYMEREFMRRAIDELLGEVLLFPVLDTMEIERRILRKQQSWGQKVLNRPLASLRLGDSRRRYHLPHYSVHNALTDALSTAELLQAQISHHFSRDLPIHELWN